MPAEAEEGAVERGSATATGGTCDSLNRVNSCLLASSFRARAAAVSKVRVEVEGAGSVFCGRGVGGIVLELEAKVWPEPLE